MKKLPIGISDFKRVIEENYYYVDKTLLIKEINEVPASIILLPRPRRFGKTLNMSMLKYFFEKTEKSNNYLFENTQIWQQEAYRQLQGQYPVIYLTFKSAKEASWEETYKKIVQALAAEFEYHAPWIHPEVLAPKLTAYEAIKSGVADKMDYSNSLKMLSELLYKSTGKRVVVLIDEYDAPIHAGYTNSYYNEATSFMRSLLGEVLKDNEYLEKGVLTGILMIAKEGIFSGLNNLWVYTILDTKFQDKFGFTEQEVEKLLQDYNLHGQATGIQDWYNGYRFGQTTIYNPWSLLGCVSMEGLLKPYWVNTSDNILIRDLLAIFPIKSDLELLLSDQPVRKEIEPSIIFPNLKDRATSIWSLLLFTGYVSYTDCELVEGITYCNLKIPNKEIRYLYKDFIKYFFTTSLGTSKTEALLVSLQSGDVATFSYLLQDFVLNSLSMYDLSNDDEPERSYHLFVLGLLVLFADVYQVKSNRESGYGRYDLMLIPRDTSKPGYVMEFKIGVSHLINRQKKFCKFNQV